MSSGSAAGGRQSLTFGCPPGDTRAGPGAGARILRLTPAFCFCRSLSLSVCFSLSFFLSVFLSLFLSAIYLSIYLSFCLSVRPSVRPSVGPSVRRSVGPSVRLSVCPSVRLSVCRSVGLSVCRSVGLSVCLSVCLSVSLSLSLSLFQTVWGLCCHILIEPILAHLGAMFSISGTYVGSSCGYVCHIWGLCWVILRASVRSSWSTFSAFDVGQCPAPTKCRLCLSARRALPTPPFTIFSASHFSMRNNLIKQCFVYLTHTKHCKLHGGRWVGGE